MSQFVDDRFADLAMRVASGAADAQDWAAEDGDLVGHAEGVVTPPRQRRAAVDAEEFAPAVIVIVIEQVEVGAVRLFFDHDHHVVEQRREAFGERVERLFDEALELGGIDGHYQPVMMLKPVTHPCVGRWNGLAA